MKRELYKCAWDVWAEYHKARVQFGIDKVVGKLVLDPHSHYCFVRDDMHRELTFDSAGCARWRGLKLELISIPNPLAERYIGDDAMVSAEVIEEPFCMYIAAAKGNGRVLYFDHPDTDKRFL